MKNDEVTLTVVHVARSGIVAELKLNKNADPYDPVTRVHAAAVVTQALIDKDLLESPPREFMAEASFHERRGDGQRSTSAMHGKVNGGVMVVATTGGKPMDLEEAIGKERAERVLAEEGLRQELKERALAEEGLRQELKDLRAKMQTGNDRVCDILTDLSVMITLSLTDLSKQITEKLLEIRAVAAPLETPD